MAFQPSDEQRDQINYNSTSMIHAYLNGNMRLARDHMGDICRLLDESSDTGPGPMADWGETLTGLTDDELSLQIVGFIMGISCERIVEGSDKR